MSLPALPRAVCAWSGGVKSGIRTLADLKGKKLGTARGGASELALFAELAKANLSWSDKPGATDVQIIYMAYADLAQALMAGHIDAMMHSEPYASQAVNKGFGIEILKPYDTAMGEPVRSLIMTEKLYANTALAQRVITCFVEATSTFIANPALAQDYVRNTMFKGQLTAEDYKDAIGNSPFTDDITIDHVQVTTDFMQKYGVGRMDNPPVAASWVKLDLLEAAKKALKTN
jgi:NitT/TauT family transport system substrate-binding protein